MRKVFKWLVIVLAMGFVAAQFIPAARTNPPFTSAQTMETVVNVPPDVHATLTRACAGCHSNQTDWPWYSYVAPTSWFVVGHVDHGRRHINFSTWVRPGKEPKDSIDRLKKMCDEVQSGGMPLTSYEIMHWHSWLSAEDRKRICEWSGAEQVRLSGTTK